MLIVALGQPYLGVWSERVGHRHAMLIGAVIAAVGFVGTRARLQRARPAAWRSLCALGYGMVFVAAQCYVLDHADAANRARSFALFIGAIMVARCAARRSAASSPTTSASAPDVRAGRVLALVLDPRRSSGCRTRRGRAGRRRARRAARIRRAAHNRRFMTVTGLAAMPAKILLTGMCFYLVPLYVLTIDSTQAMAGRILMIYGVVMVVMAPLAAALATTRGAWMAGRRRPGGVRHSAALLLLAGGGMCAGSSPPSFWSGLASRCRSPRRARSWANIAEPRSPIGDRRRLRRVSPARTPGQRAGPADGRAAGVARSATAPVSSSSARRRVVILCGLVFLLSAPAPSTRGRPGRALREAESFVFGGESHGMNNPSHAPPPVAAALARLAASARCGRIQLQRPSAGAGGRTPAAKLRFASTRSPFAA